MITLSDGLEIDEGHWENPEFSEDLVAKSYISATLMLLEKLHVEILAITEK